VIDLADLMLFCGLFVYTVHGQATLLAVHLLHAGHNGIPGRELFYIHPVTQIHRTSSSTLMPTFNHFCIDAELSTGAWTHAKARNTGHHC
jgi:hypothetical protein